MKALTSRDIYAFYVQRGGTLPWTKWRDVVSRFNDMVMDEIVFQGRELDMGAGLSKLSVIRIERNFSAPRVDWPATNKLKAELIAEGKLLFSEDHPEGEQYLIYFTDDWYCRFYWDKYNCKVRNKSAYRFDASRGLKGNKTKLIRHLQADSLAHLNYDKAHK